ncbi:MAG: cyclophilin-like fold protein [Candidatus Sumerlaeota bacterium]|nr:cyclophilin-like fold protein [Candidatus Sumerlaeota bacterium]
MSTKIAIETAGGAVSAELSDNECARAIAARLPVAAQANTWGEEIYFEIGINAALDDTARKTVALGDIGYWPDGDAICFFFGRTPISSAKEIRPASAVNVVGRIHGDLEILKRVRDGETVTLRASEKS